MAESRGYLHGFDPTEQARLYEQARFLEGRVFEGVDFSRQAHIVEVGCGVGAQTEILLERFPHLKIAALDASPENLAAARRRLGDAEAAGRVTFTQGDARHLPYHDGEFDGAFVCWFLEHLEDPAGGLAEIHRVLTPGAVIHCTEVLNATFFLDPYSPATLQYLFQYNDHQWNLKGDPFVGAKLGNLLLRAGYQRIETRVKSFLYDNRSPKRRAQMIDYWSRLFLSGVDGMIRAGKVTPELVAAMKTELESLKHDPDAVLFDAFIQATAQVD